MFSEEFIILFLSIVLFSTILFVLFRIKSLNSYLRFVLGLAALFTGPLAALSLMFFVNSFTRDTFLSFTSELILVVLPLAVASSVVATNYGLKLNDRGLGDSIFGALFFSAAHSLVLYYSVSFYGHFFPGIGSGIGLLVLLILSIFILIGTNIACRILSSSMKN